MYLEAADVSLATNVESVNRYQIYARLAAALVTQTLQCSFC